MPVFYLELHPKPSFDDYFESSEFSRASDELVEIEEHLKIKNHFELFSYAPQNGLCPPGYEETEIPWFEPDEGILWLASVIDHIGPIQLRLSIMRNW